MRSPSRTRRLLTVFVVLLLLVPALSAGVTGSATLDDGDGENTKEQPNNGQSQNQEKDTSNGQSQNQEKDTSNGQSQNQEKDTSNGQSQNQEKDTSNDKSNNGDSANDASENRGNSDSAPGRNDEDGERGNSDAAPGQSDERGPPEDRGKESGDRGKAPDRAQGPPEQTGLDAVPANAGVSRATVRNATPGKPVSVDVSEARSSRLGVSGFELTPERGGDFDIGVAASDTPPSDAPVFEGGANGVHAGTSALSHVRVTHSIRDQNISGVTFTLEVEKSQVRQYGAGPEHLALYRYHDGEWTELETGLLEERADTYLVRARSPGLSDFAVGLKRPEFELQWSSIAETHVTAEEEVVVRARVHNSGGAEGTHQVELTIDGETVERRAVTVTAGGTRQVTFRRSLAAGSHDISVDGEHVGRVAVETDPGDAEQMVAAERSEQEAPGFGVGAAVLALLAAAFLGRRR